MFVNIVLQYFSLWLKVFLCFKYFHKFYMWAFVSEAVGVHMRLIFTCRYPVDRVKNMFK